MQPEPACLHMDISGRVQGVGFRAALQDKAQSLQLAGWVRNRRDGHVEALVQGAPVAVDAMRDWCQRGPPAARVDAVQCTAQTPEPGLTALRCIATA